MRVVSYLWLLFFLNSFALHCIKDKQIFSRWRTGPTQSVLTALTTGNRNSLRAPTLPFPKRNGPAFTDRVIFPRWS